MSDHQHRFISRAFMILRTEGLVSLGKRALARIEKGVFRTRLFVLGCPLDAEHSPSARQGELSGRSAMLQTLCIKQLTENDVREISELAEIDEWKIPKSVTVSELRDGWRCYAAKHEDKIIASAWSSGRQAQFADFYLKREFTLAPDESYYWRAFCVPAYRGNGVMLYLYSYMMRDASLSEGKIYHLTLVRVENRRMIRALGKIGWQVVGRAGFYEIFGIRLHYLWGHKAFKDTKKRFFIKSMK